MIEDEDSLFLFLQYGARPPMISQPTGRPVFNQTSRAFRNEPYYGTYVSDPRPTKAEAKKQLEILSVPFRLGAPFAPPQVRPVLVGAPRLAEILINIDPQDRFRD
jgi:hypothetical protein